MEQDDKKEIRRLKAEARRLKRLLTVVEEDTFVADRIIRVIRDSIEALPPIQQPAIFVPDPSKHDETAILVLSDIHIGKKTPTYRPSVFVKRMACLKENMMSIVGAQRSARPIRKLVLVFNGDILDCESIYPMQATNGIAVPILDQIFSVGLPHLTDFIYFCLANFEEVTIYATPGNHGRLYQSKWTNHPSTNWDVVLYKSLEAATRNQPNLHWNICEVDWKALFRVEGHGFLATHGDMIRMYYNLPHYGQTRQATRWQSAYRDKIRLTYFIFSHFHSINTGSRFNQVVIFANGSWVTDDDFGERQLGVASVPEQLLLFCHPKHGVTARYAIALT